MTLQKKIRRRVSAWARTWFMSWRWPRRVKCHKSIGCCQLIDRPNDNQA